MVSAFAVRQRLVLGQIKVAGKPDPNLLLSVGVGALDGPDGGDISYPRRLRDLRAVHQPDRHIAAGVMPENVAHAIAVEVPGSDDRPGGRYTSDPHDLRYLRAVHQTDRNIAADVAPENVALAVAVEVPGSDDRPGGRHISDPHGLRDLRAVHEPDHHVAAGVMPEDVALAVAVEVPVPAIDHAVDIFPTPAACGICEPFMNQIATLPLVSRHSQSYLPSPTMLISAACQPCAVERPDGLGYVARRHLGRDVVAVAYLVGPAPPAGRRIRTCRGGRARYFLPFGARIRGREAPLLRRGNSRHAFTPIMQSLSGRRRCRRWRGIGVRRLRAALGRRQQGR